MTHKPVTLSVLVDGIAKGARLAIPADYAGVALSATLEIIRQGIGGLQLVTAPTSGLQADLLIGAGHVNSIETAGVSLGEYGMAERFRAALAAGQIAIKDSTCPALHAAFQAAEKGIPFLPLRGILGTDLLANRPDWKVIQNPFAVAGDPIVLIPAIRPDVTLFHAAQADSAGNVWIGTRRELVTLAHASARTLVTVEELHPGNLLDDPLTAPGTLPHLYVHRVAVVPGGTWPLPLQGRVPADEGELTRYAEASLSPAAFASLVEEWLDARS
jgi:glutaconate CoA-transferase subunit A